MIDKPVSWTQPQNSNDIEESALKYYERLIVDWYKNNEITKIFINKFDKKIASKNKKDTNYKRAYYRLLDNDSVFHMNIVSISNVLKRYNIFKPTELEA